MRLIALCSLATLTTARYNDLSDKLANKAAKHEKWVEKKAEAAANKAEKIANKGENRGQVEKKAAYKLIKTAKIALNKEMWKQRAAAKEGDFCGRALAKFNQLKRKENPDHVDLKFSEAQEMPEFTKCQDMPDPVEEGEVNIDGVVNVCFCPYGYPETGAGCSETGAHECLPDSCENGYVYDSVSKECNVRSMTMRSGATVGGQHQTFNEWDLSFDVQMSPQTLGDVQANPLNEPYGLMQIGEADNPLATITVDQTDLGAVTVDFGLDGVGNHHQETLPFPDLADGNEHNIEIIVHQSQEDSGADVQILFDGVDQPLSTDNFSSDLLNTDEEDMNIYIPAADQPEIPDTIIGAVTLEKYCKEGFESAGDLCKVVKDKLRVGDKYYLSVLGNPESQLKSRGDASNNANAGTHRVIVNSAGNDEFPLRNQWRVVSALWTEATSGSISLESVQWPGNYIRHHNGEMWLDTFKDEDTFKMESSFLVKDALWDNGEDRVSLQSANEAGKFLRYEGEDVNLHERGSSELYLQDTTWVFNNVKNDKKCDILGDMAAFWNDVYPDHWSSYTDYEAKEWLKYEKPEWYDIIGSARWNAWDYLEIREYLEAYKEDYINNMCYWWHTVKGLIDDAQNWIDDVVDMVEDVVDAIGDAAQDAVDHVVDTAEEVLDEISDGDILGAAGAVLDAQNDALGAAADLAGDAANAAADAVSDVADSFSDTAGSVVESFSNWWGKK